MTTSLLRHHLLKQLLMQKAKTVVIKRFYFIVSGLERFRVDDVIWVEICAVVQKRV
jgi:hypothetical protein